MSSNHQNHQEMSKEKSKMQKIYDKARSEPMYEKLRQIGITDVRKSNRRAWYISPFRNENTASLKVDFKENLWYDFGGGFGGNIFDFYMKYFNCSHKEALEKINETPSFSSHQHFSEIDKNTKSSIELISVSKIRNLALREYLTFRGLDYIDYEKYLEEVWYTVNGKKLFSIGFKNIHNGYELRNKIMKSSIGKKGLSVFENGSKSVFLFEGFLDFISYQKLYGIILDDVIVLNSVSNLKRANLLLKSYSKIVLVFDNDTAGIDAANSIKKEFENVFDNSVFYAGYNDVNEFLINKSNKINF